VVHQFVKKREEYNFPGLHLRFWRFTKERALKRPRTDSRNRKSPFLMSENRGLRRFLALEVASLFNAEAMQRAMI